MCITVIGAPTLVITVFWALTFKRLGFIEFLSPAMFVCFAIGLVPINLRDTDATNRQNQIFVLTALELIFALYMSSTWFWAFIARSLFFMPTMTALIQN